MNANKLEISLDRDSVCAGDDTSSHEEKILSEDQTSISDLLFSVIDSNFFAWIAGPGCWVVKINGIPTGVINQRWTKVNLLLLVNPETTLRIIFDENPCSIYFQYWASADPDLIFSCIKYRKKFPKRSSKHKPSWYRLFQITGIEPKPDP